MDWWVNVCMRDECNVGGFVVLIDYCIDGCFVVRIVWICD